MIKKTLLLCTLAMLTAYHSNSQVAKVYSITIENKGAMPYMSKVVSIPWSKVKATYPAIDTNSLKVLDAVTKKELVYQLEYAGNMDVQNLLVQVNLKPKSTLKLVLQKGKHANFSTKTFARYVPERKDDFAWENDKIAFRMYGKALEKTPKENAYGIDVWVKRTDKMIINERYKRGEYHVDHGDGLDYYHVGYSLGAGNVMPFVNDTIRYSKNYVQWTILDNGPLRTTFKLDYDAWDVSGKKVIATKTVTLDAGSQLNKVSVDYKYEGDENLPVVIGIIKRPEPGIELLNETGGIMAYWEPQHGGDGITAVGCIIPLPVKEMQVKDNQLLAFSQTVKNKPFVYYTGAAWNKAGVITTPTKWFEYLEQFKKQLTENAIMVK